jgi:hypothetical protein
MRPAQLSIGQAKEAKMAYVARPSAFHGATRWPAPAAISSQPAAKRRSFWRAVFDAVFDANERNAQREVERFVARRGKLTDSMERDIAERLIRPGGRWS